MDSSKLGMDFTWILYYRKRVKLSPTKQDDIIFDAVLKPIFDKFKK